MIRYKDIAFIAYPVIDIARARSFYEGVLGLKPNAPLKSETRHGSSTISVPVRSASAARRNGCLRRTGHPLHLR